MEFTSNSKGNLLKTQFNKDGVIYFGKSGRLQVRGYQNSFGIEPIIEVICYELGKLLELKIAKQKLMVTTINRRNKEIKTLLNISPDFRNGETLIYLQDLYSLKEVPDMSFETLIRYGVNKECLIDLLMFDLITMNEDRHSTNVAFINNKTTIFDNGYSLLYDDINGMKRDFIKSSKLCLCNAPIYEESFYNMEKLWKKYGTRDKLQIDIQSISNTVYKVKNRYDKIILKNDINNIQLDDSWWQNVVLFIQWRLSILNERLNYADD